MQCIIHKHIENVLLRLGTTFKVQQRLLRTKQLLCLINTVPHFIVQIFLFLNVGQISHILFHGIGANDGFEYSAPRCQQCNPGTLDREDRNVYGTQRCKANMQLGTPSCCRCGKRFGVTSSFPSSLHSWGEKELHAGNRETHAGFRGTQARNTAKTYLMQPRNS